MKHDKQTRKKHQDTKKNTKKHEKKQKKNKKKHEKTRKKQMHETVNNAKTKRRGMNQQSITGCPGFGGDTEYIYIYCTCTIHTNNKYLIYCIVGT